MAVVITFYITYRILVKTSVLPNIIGRYFCITDYYWLILLYYWILFTYHIPVDTSVLAVPNVTSNTGQYLTHWSIPLYNRILLVNTLVLPNITYHTLVSISVLLVPYITYRTLVDMYLIIMFVSSCIITYFNNKFISRKSLMLSTAFWFLQHDQLNEWVFFLPQSRLCSLSRTRQLFWKILSLIMLSLGSDQFWDWAVSL